MNRSTYWGVVVTSVVSIVTSNLPSTTPLAAAILYLIGATGIFTAVYERAKATGRNPWLWLLLSLFPLVLIRLGSLPDSAAPQPQLKLIKTTGLSFAGAVVFLIAAVVAYPLVTPLHDQLAQEVINDNASLPKKIDDITTLTTERVNGLQVIYGLELNGELRDSSFVQNRLTGNICANSDTRNAMANGVTYRYEYRSAGKFLGGFDVTSCPSVVAAKTKADANTVPVVDTTPTPVPAGFQDVGPLAYDYSIVGDRFIIHAKGSISLNEHVAFNKFRDTWANLPTGNIKRIMLSLDSDGGSVAGAMAMTDWVKQYKVETVVPNGAVCASACVLIWGAGAVKSVGENAKIGVHRPTNMVAGASADLTADTEAAATGVMAQTLVDEKAPPAVIGYLTMTSGDDMHWLTAADAVAWGATVLDKNGEPNVASK